MLSARYWLLVAAVVMLSAGSLCSIAVAGGQPGKKIAQQTANGDHAEVSVSVTANHPKALFLRVKSRPGQKVTTHYLVTCTRGYVSKSKSRKVVARGAFQRRLKLTSVDSDVCYVIASSKLRRTGFIRLQIFKR